MRVKMLYPAHVAGRLAKAGETVEVQPLVGISLVDGGVAVAVGLPSAAPLPTSPKPKADVAKKPKKKGKVGIRWPKKGGKA